MNEIILMGRLVKDVELHQSYGKIYGRFTLAINNKNKEKEKTLYVPCVVWNSKIAENLAKYVGKGNRILVSGKLNIFYKEQKQFSNVNVKNIQFIDFKEKNNYPF